MPQTLEFHQLDRRLPHLRVRHPARFRQLMASLAETGQQTPIVVVQQASPYLVINGQLMRLGWGDPLADVPFPGH